MRLRFHRLKGMEVVADREGRLLGSVRKLLFDTKHRLVLGLVFKPRALSSERWAKMTSIQRVGEDIVFLSDARAVREEAPPGRDLKEMEGLSITSLEGKRLGALDDVVIDTNGWKLVALVLDNGGEIDLGEDSVLGEDTILMRKGAAEEIHPAESNHGGFFSRMFSHADRVKPTWENPRRQKSKRVAGREKPEEAKPEPKPEPKSD
jgi:uncharacterized protein YrrD